MKKCRSISVLTSEIDLKRYLRPSLLNSLANKQKNMTFYRTVRKNAIKVIEVSTTGNKSIRFLVILFSVLLPCDNQCLHKTFMLFLKKET